MKKLLSILWQLPQNIIGFFLWVFLAPRKEKDYYVWKFNSGVSLGSFIFVSENMGENCVKHEKGHQKQSRMLGWFYLVIIGIPSITWNILKRLGLFKKKSYYSFYPEKWANKLGGVKEENVN